MNTQAEPISPEPSLPETARAYFDPRALVLVGLSLSIGWGIRGQFGHEYGAMLPGALAAMAMALISSRPDWQRRVAYFGLFGALGWAFGGSMAYMHLIAYTQSGDSLTVWYGFAMLFVVGFFWGAMGGAGTAMPAYLKRERLIEFFIPMTAIFAVFVVFDALVSVPRFSNGDSYVVHWLNGMYPHVEFFSNRKHYDALEWLDSDYQAAGLALLTTLGYAAYRRKIDKATSLILHLCVGWWIGFLLLPNLLHIKMMPPKGDNWAGMLGMVTAMLLFFKRDEQHGINLVTLVTGFVGGLGFATATVLKQLEMHFMPGISTNWHSILEQSYGLINGLGVAVAMCMVLRLAPRQSDDPPTERWTEAWSVFFVLVTITYVNIVKELEDWTRTKAMPEQLYFLTAQGWFDLFYLGIAIVAIILLWAQIRRGLAVLTMNWMGRGQLLYLMLLWWMILGDIGKEIVSFAPQRLVTEGTMFINCLVCTVLVLLWTRTEPQFRPDPPPDYAPRIRKTVVAGLLTFAASTVIYWGAVRATWGNTPVNPNDLKIRFGPHSTINLPPDY